MSKKISPKGSQGTSKPAAKEKVLGTKKAPRPKASPAKK
jgi:hypothetical protein